MLGSLILYLKSIRIMMFQLSGFYYRGSFKVPLRRAPDFQASFWGSVRG